MERKCRVLQDTYRGIRLKYRRK